MSARKYKGNRLLLNLVNGLPTDAYRAVVKSYSMVDRSLKSMLPEDARWVNVMLTESFNQAASRYHRSGGNYEELFMALNNASKVFQEMETFRDRNQAVASLITYLHMGIKEEISTPKKTFGGLSVRDVMDKIRFATPFESPSFLDARLA